MLVTRGISKIPVKGVKSVTSGVSEDAVTASKNVVKDVSKGAVAPSLLKQNQILLSFGQAEQMVLVGLSERWKLLNSSKVELHWRVSSKAKGLKCLNGISIIQVPLKHGKMSQPHTLIMFLEMFVLL